jgi:hypothetical protein
MRAGTRGPPNDFKKKYCDFLEGGWERAGKRN